MTARPYYVVQDGPLLRVTLIPDLPTVTRVAPRPDYSRLHRRRAKALLFLSLLILASALFVADFTLLGVKLADAANATAVTNVAAPPSAETTANLPLMSTMVSRAVMSGAGTMETTPAFTLTGAATLFRFKNTGKGPYRVVLHRNDAGDVSGDDLVLFIGSGGNAQSEYLVALPAGTCSLSITTPDNGWTLTVSEAQSLLAALRLAVHL